MSKIPRSHYVSNLKPPSSLTSTPLETSKKNFRGAVDSSTSRFGDGVDLSAIENSSDSSRLVSKSYAVKSTPRTEPLKPTNVNRLKRSAPPTLSTVPKKQIRPNVVAAKLPPTDHKARFEELLEKYEALMTEHDDVQNKYTECYDELQETKGLLSSKTEELSSNRINLDNVLKNAKEEFVTLETEKSTIENELKNSERRLSELAKEHSSLKTDLMVANDKYALKSNEYDSLKEKLNEEIKKTLELTSMMEENRLKLSTFSSEIEFLKSKQSILEQKNTENNTLIADLRIENEKLNSNLTRLEKDCGSLRESLDSMTEKCERFTKLYNSETEKCSELSAILESERSKVVKFTQRVMDLNGDKQCLEMTNRDQSNEIETLRSKLEELQGRLENMHENEKSLRNTIQDLKGHIRVYCRVKPVMNEEKSKPVLNVDIVDSCTMEIEKTVVNSTSGLSKKQNNKHAFAFDGVFSSTSTQSEIFEEVSSLVQSALDGYNVCIFAYGQTGSGKTFTMEGETDYSGIVPRAIKMVFDNVPELKKLGWEFNISVSFLEIYNENIYDLLDSNRDQLDHSIKMTDSKGTDVYVSNLKEETVTECDELMRLFKTSQRNRQTAATLCNERSSRSHSVAKIKINAVHEKRKEKYSSSLNFIDLAGSESGKTTQRMDETKSINKSLSELSKVILALQSKQTHVPYRNSKLTYLLMPSLSGNSKTLMLVNVSQMDDCYNETLNSLRFAAKVNSCRTGVSKRNVSSL